MKNDILTLKARIKIIDVFLDHYFQDLNEWKHGFKTEINIEINDDSFYLEILDGESIYERWTFDDIESYIKNNIDYE